MESQTIFTMSIVTILVWGGFITVLTRAVRAESAKHKD